METTKTEGTLRQAVGEVKETVGSLAGDVGLQLKGTADELRGKAQQLCSDTSGLARDAMSAKPITVLACAVGMGFVIGALWSRGRDS